MMYRVFVIGLVLFFHFVRPGFAMKPAPFEKITYTDKATNFRVHSDPTTQQTQVFDQKGQKIWSMDTFVGRKQLFVSPDGNMLLCFGSYYFGPILKSGADAVVLEVYVKGKKDQQMTFKQFFGMTQKEAIERLQINRFGGGWLAPFVSFQDVDWKAKKMHFTYKDGSKGSVQF